MLCYNPKHRITSKEALVLANDLYEQVAQHKPLLFYKKPQYTNGWAQNNTPPIPEKNNMDMLNFDENILMVGRNLHDKAMETSINDKEKAPVMLQINKRPSPGTKGKTQDGDVQNGYQVQKDEEEPMAIIKNKVNKASSDQSMHFQNINLQKPEVHGAPTIQAIKSEIYKGNRTFSQRKNFLPIKHQNLIKKRHNDERLQLTNIIQMGISNNLILGDVKLSKSENSGLSDDRFNVNSNITS